MAIPFTLSDAVVLASPAMLLAVSLYWPQSFLSALEIFSMV